MRKPHDLRSARRIRSIGRLGNRGFCLLQVRSPHCSGPTSSLTSRGIVGLWPQALCSVNENRHRSYLGYQEAAKPTRGPTTERVQLTERGRSSLMVGFTEGGVEPCGPAGWVDRCWAGFVIIAQNTTPVPRGPALNSRIKVQKCRFISSFV